MKWRSSNGRFDEVLVLMIQASNQLSIHCLLLLLLIVSITNQSEKVKWEPSDEYFEKFYEQLAPIIKREVHPDAIKNIYDCFATRVDDEDVKKKIKFLYYSRKNPEHAEQLKPGEANSLLKENINKPFKFLVHGYYIYSPGNKSYIDFRKNVLDVMDSNVITVDWKVVKEKHWFYHKVAKNTVFVGRYLASLLDWIIEQGANPSDIHIAGHSLGAHVSGYAGSFIKRGKIGRISGLDPALPGFVKVSNNSRLDMSDAQFVDCIHTCGGLLGTLEPICHADFYPNGGRNHQPGCCVIDLPGVCSHMRASEYFIESIRPGNYFPAALCPTIPSHNPRNCTWTDYMMGFYLEPSARGLFYVQTRATRPYSIARSDIHKTMPKKITISKQ
ncbi:unnamed protein product [Nezara viridula]|uniref:Lipase domain-containing protein n=1 Tax=Nezara viridula TaxID=85310 RepID=A0A9P0MET3_NEZVI|nr:unnamed protein product [Nezara viridula]